MEKILVDKDEYEKLLTDSQFLKVLYEVGLDNWDGWEMAITIYRERYKCKAQ